MGDSHIELLRSDDQERKASSASNASSSSDTSYLDDEFKDLRGARRASRSEQLLSFATASGRRFSAYRQSLPPDLRSSIWHILRSAASSASPFLLATLPRFMQEGGLRPTKKAHPTSYLDALRGISAVIVLNHHHCPYEGTWFIDLPFVRLVRSGRGMVDVFFVISGYVLSYRLIKLMRTKQSVPLLDALSSAVFRRYIRLYVSAIAATFIAFSMSRMNLAFIPRRGSFFHQLWDWMQDVGAYSNPFADLKGYWEPGVFQIKYLEVVWTIPLEFRGSIFLYLFCIASCKLTTRNRMLLCSLLILLCYYWAAIYAALFLAGAFVAEMSFNRHPERLDPNLALSIPRNSGDVESNPPSQSLLERITYSSMLVISLFLVSQPNENLAGSFWPWPYLEKFIPPNYANSPIAEHFWLSIGAVMLVVALDFCPSLQTFLKWNFCRYLGDLSFGIYVMHNIVVWSLWRRFLDPWRIYLLGEQMWTFVPILVVNYVAVLWAADLFSRLDLKIVTFGRWLEGQLFT